MIIETLQKCECGAYTLTTEEGDFSMSEETYEKHFSEFEVLDDNFNEWGNCNHCVNHWGIDLCACGSGESPEECEEDLDSCGKPYQVLGVEPPTLFEMMRKW